MCGTSTITKTRTSKSPSTCTSPIIESCKIKCPDGEGCVSGQCITCTSASWSTNYGSCDIPSNSCSGTQKKTCNEGTCGVGCSSNCNEKCTGTAPSKTCPKTCPPEHVCKSGICDLPPCVYSEWDTCDIGTKTCGYGTRTKVLEDGPSTCASSITEPCEEKCLDGEGCVSGQCITCTSASWSTDYGSCVFPRQNTCFGTQKKTCNEGTCGVGCSSSCNADCVGSPPSKTCSKTCPPEHVCKIGRCVPLEKGVCGPIGDGRGWCDQWPMTNIYANLQDNDTHYRWSCTKEATKICSFPKTPADGECKSNFAIGYNSHLRCTVGTVTDFEKHGYCEWNCKGLNGGSDLDDTCYSDTHTKCVKSSNGKCVKTGRVCKKNIKRR